MNRWQRVAVIAVPIIAVIGGAAWFFRYEPMPPQNAIWEQVWDRWYNRVCLTPRPEATNVHGVACNQAEVAALTEQMVAEATAREKRERPAREAEERARQAEIAWQQAELNARLEQEKKTNMAAKEKWEALENHIHQYLKPNDFVGAPEKWQINQMRMDGHSEQYIAEQVLPWRNKILAAGAPKDIVDEYFGGDPFLKPGSKP
jgi:hypothetical protein